MLDEIIIIPNRNRLNAARYNLNFAIECYSKRLLNLTGLPFSQRSPSNPEGQTQRYPLSVKPD